MALSAKNQEPATIVISGAGIVGLVLALALKKQIGVTAEVYERAVAFHDDVGAGMGMYPNGMRVIRDIDLELFQEIREQGEPYGYRRWERHDGSEIMTADEEVLCRGDKELESLGIRRWRLQKVLFEAAKKQGIPIFFGKECVNVHSLPDGLVELVFQDGTRRLSQVLFGADGSKSKVRQVVTAKEGGDVPPPSLTYTGVTCLMGIAADCSKEGKGISFPSSTSTKCHGSFFPTGESEQCFQFHFPITEDESQSTEWGTLSTEICKEQCCQLAERLRSDGWNEKYLAPLENVTKAVKVGFCTLSPRLDTWVYGRGGRIVLVGDAAHPPVPYNGQGSQQGLEDAGTIALLLREMCLGPHKQFNLAKFSEAMKIYESIRIPHTSEILDLAFSLGRMQQRRAESKKLDVIQAEKIQRQVFYHETLPAMLPGALHDYKQDVVRVMQEFPHRLKCLPELPEECLPEEVPEE